MNTKKLVSLFLILALLIGCVGCSGAQSSAPAPGQSTSVSATASSSAAPASKAPQKKFFNLAATAATAILYPYWVAVGKTIETVYPEYQITVSEDRGSTFTSERIRTGESDLGNGVTKSDYDNFHGLNDFEGRPNPKARILWYFDMFLYTFCVSQESGITSFSELEGKRISAGGTGSTLSTITTDLMKDIGVTPVYYDSSKADAADAYGHRQIVGVPTSAAIPDSFIMQLNANLPVHILSMTDDEVTKAMTGKPFFTKALIPGGSFDNNPQEIQTLSYMQGAQTDDDLSQEDGYKFIKAVYEHVDMWATAMPSASKQDVIKLTLNSPILLHAGMVQYMKEKGVTVPAELIPPEYVGP